MFKRILQLIVPLLLSVSLWGQSVGVVLSGGGAGGVAHIGVLKALEENNIPIDFITGTSMGALVGGLYASGYSIREIEEIFVSNKFQNWAKGKLNEKYVYYLKKHEQDASWITVKFSPDSVFETNLPTNLVSPVAIDYGLMEMLSPAAAAANYNFDSLFVPFRAVAADIIDKEEVIFQDGHLSKAVRASMAYPFYLKPIKHEGKLLFDGGLYNNFPSDVMYDAFMPDFIIGSNVSSNFPEPDEDNLLSQLRTMLTNNTDYGIECENGVIIEPYVEDISTFDFDRNKKTINIGYRAALPYIDSIKQEVNRRVDPENLKNQRKAFNSKKPDLIFNNINISGIDSSQMNYIKKSLRYRSDTISVQRLRPEYVKLASDEKIKQIYPQAVYNPSTGYYDLNLRIKKEKDLFVSFGGNISNRPINEGFIGLQYNYFGRAAITLAGNTYFGKYYSSAQARARLDFAFRLPFYLESKYTINKWDYFKSSSSFFEDSKPSYLIVRDSYFEGNMGIPVAYKGKINIGGAFSSLSNEYYQTNDFLESDTADFTTFDNYSAFVHFERNSLNRKQYATEGSSLQFKSRYITGKELTIPGSTAPPEKQTFRNNLEWFQLKLKYDKYFNKDWRVKLGFLGEMVYSNQPFFNNYTASILSAPAFQPIPESKSLFQERFRAHSYVAGGLKNIYEIGNNFQIRLEGYVFQPLNEIQQTEDRSPHYGKEFSIRYFLGTFATVYHTPVGPVSLSLNYYDKAEQQFSFLFHFGYIIFNDKALD